MGEMGEIVRIHWQHWGMPDLLVSGGHPWLCSNCPKWHESLSWWCLRWVYATAGRFSGGHHVPYSGAVHGVFQDYLCKTVRHQLLSCFDGDTAHIFCWSLEKIAETSLYDMCVFPVWFVHPRIFWMCSKVAGMGPVLGWFLYQFQASRCSSHISWWKACQLQLWVASSCCFFQIRTVVCPVIRAAGHIWASTWLPTCPSTSHWPGVYWCLRSAEQLFACFKWYPTGNIY